MTDNNQTDHSDTDEYPAGTAPKNGLDPEDQEVPAADRSKDSEGSVANPSAAAEDTDSEEQNDADSRDSGETAASAPSDGGTRYLVELGYEDGEGSSAEVTDDEGTSSGTANRSFDDDCDNSNAAPTGEDTDLDTVDGGPQSENPTIRSDTNSANTKGHPDDHTDDTGPNPETYAAIHRSLGNAGSHLNEAHTHVSSLRSVGAVESTADREVARAEIEALVEILVQTRKDLDRALSRASTAATELNVDVPADEALEESVDEDVPEILWNTS